MTAFAGLVRFDGAPIDPAGEERLSRALGSQTKGRVLTSRCQGAVFVQRAGADGPDTRRNPGPLRPGLFAASGRLDNRDELADALGIPGSERRGLSDARLIEGMFARWGPAGVARCIGAFAFAQWNAAARRLTLGRDCLGHRVLLFHRTERFAVFASLLGVLFAQHEVPRALDEEMLASFLVLNHKERRRTLYRGIERTPSRSLVTIDPSGARDRIYWSPRLDGPPPFRRDEDYVERARELFDRAVADAIRDAPDFAVGLSGGLDSSAIAATIARRGDRARIPCYTLVPPAGMQLELEPDRYLDERDKVRALGRMYPQLQIGFIAPQGLHPLEEDDTRLFAQLGVPALGASLIGRAAFVQDAIRAARHPVLLIGSRGNVGLSWDGGSSLLSLIKAGHWLAFARELSALAREGNVGRAQAFRSWVLMQGAPEWLRSFFHRVRGRDPYSVARYSALNPDYITAHDLRRRWRAQRFDPWRQPAGWNPAQFRAEALFDYAGAQRDNMDWVRECDGLDLRDPHADRRLLEFALQVPEHLYRKNGVKRSFARAVFADRLPPDILAERRRGYSGGGPWFRSLDPRRQDIAAEIERLESSPAACRLLDLPRLKRLVDEWPRDEQTAQARERDYKLALTRGIHVGRFIRWVEGGNA